MLSVVKLHNILYYLGANKLYILQSSLHYHVQTFIIY